MIRLSSGKISKTLFRRKSCVLFISTQADYIDHHKILSTHLQIDDAMAREIAESQGLTSLSKLYLTRNCKLCDKHKVELTSKKYIGACLKLHPVTLEHRILLLQEMGVPRLSATQIRRVPFNMNKRVLRFKAIHHIPTDQCIVDNIFNSVGGSPRDITPLKDISHKVTTLELYRACMMHHKTWNLHFPKCPPPYKKFQSFRLVRDVLKFLTTELNLDLEFIAKHAYLLNISIDYAREVMQALKDTRIAEMDFSDFCRRYPNVLTFDYENVKEILKILKKYRLPDNSPLSCLNILEIEPALFEERMKIILDTPVLAVWAQHPRISYLIFHFKLVQDRIRFLQSLGRLSTANMHAITAVKHFFLRYVQSNTPHNGHSKFLEYVITKTLKSCDIKYVARHPYWKTSSFVDVHKMLVYLKKNFAAEDILRNIHIIFYPKSEVHKTLQTIYKDYSPETGYNYTPSQYLALCLYMLEKDNHFTGDGIWKGRTFDEPDFNMAEIFSEADMESIDVWDKIRSLKSQPRKRVTRVGK